MASLYFYYSAMNAGKSSNLLQSAYNYEERGMKTMLLTSDLDNRYGTKKIASRIGLEAEADTFAPLDDLSMRDYKDIDCVLVDEAQFLTKEQVLQLCDVVDLMNIPVLCYGIRTDFQGELFEGSAALLANAEKLIELKTICHCGRKATHNKRLVNSTEKVLIGDNDMYVSVCRKHLK